MVRKLGGNTLAQLLVRPLIGGGDQTTIGFALGRDSGGLGHQLCGDRLGSGLTKAQNLWPKSLHVES
jgi:hypothetical protein